MSNVETLESVRLACERSARQVHVELATGLGSLSSITTVAPFIGLIGTALVTWSSFTGLGGGPSIAFSFGRLLSQSLWPAALGLLVAVVASCSHGYLSARCEEFDVEMQNASLELLDNLSFHLRK